MRLLFAKFLRKTLPVQHLPLVVVAGRSYELHYLGTSMANEPFEVEGIDLWACEPWRQVLPDVVKIPCWRYKGEVQTLKVFEVHAETGTILFAAGELSNLVYCFYRLLPSEQTVD